MVMKVEAPRGPTSAADARRAAKPAGSGEVFASMLGEEEVKTSATNLAAPATAVEGLLALQEVGDERQTRRRAKNRASAMLDELDKLRHALLDGTITIAQLNRLVAVIASERVSTADPQLNELLDDIDLRAQVELAKLEHRE
jgi:hypothetical protein